MISFILTFLLGDLWLQTFKQLPSLFFILNTIIITLVLIFILLLVKQTRFIILPIAFICGFLWTLWCIHSIYSWTLKKEWEGKPLIVKGYLSSLPITGKFGTTFEFYLQELVHVNAVEHPNALIRLTWPKNDKQLRVGEQWHLLIRLKRIHGTQSPGAFDYEAWALQKAIRASGYVIKHSENKLISPAGFYHLLAKFRELIQARILSYSSQVDLSPWLMALIIGERNGISSKDWQVLRNTGTNHLMAIGGLHIGILAGFAHYGAAWLWRRSSLLMYLAPAAHIGACASLLIAILYSSLSGFLIPTQRASIMLTVFIITILTNRKINAWNAWCFALLCVLILNPLSVLTESLWLSFATIALIIYGMSYRLSPSGIWWKWARVQWIIGIGLIPLTLWLFQECSLVSFIANSIAIPWLGIAILPFCFLSTVFIFIYPPLGNLCLLIANYSLNTLWMILSWLAQFQFSSLHLAILNFPSFLFIIIGVLLLLLPAGMPGRWLGLIWIMPAIFITPSKLSLGEFRLTLLDVGQGLSTVIQTKDHLLIYDAGPKYDAATDSGESIVLPFLRKAKINNIDMLVISHGDNDHIGGAYAILNAFPQTKIKTSVPDKFSSVFVSLCKAGETWQWDQVKFTFLYPFPNRTNLGNDSSCVLLIENKQYRVLLTGDIEKLAENDLLTHMRHQLSSHIIIAPHHGSKTSGLEKFITAVYPQIVLYATGYRNRYHFPHQSVVAAYEKINAQSFNTADSGTIQFLIPTFPPLPTPERYRVTNKKYWFDEP